VNKIRKIERGIYQVPLFLSPSLEQCRTSLEKQLLNAQRRLRDFARHYHWEKHAEECFMEQAKIFDTQEKFIQELKNLLQLPEDFELPKTISACLEKRVLVAISSDLYKIIYPEGYEKNFYEKLMTHELAHRLHIRILDGNEENMGQIWFFEGFALFAAGQFCNDKKKPGNVWEIITSTKRGSYQEYARVFRYFANIIPLPVLIEHAGEQDFSVWLKNKIMIK